MKNILIFGFSGFDIFPQNPSKDVVHALAARRIPGIRIDKAIFKVSYAHVEKRIPHLLAGKNYDAVVGFGLARGAVGVRLEKEAHNRISSRTADNDGCRPRQRKIIRGAPDMFRSPIGLVRLRQVLLKQGIPAAISHDAGGFVCNFTYYQFFHHLNKAPKRTKCLFVHFPLTCAIVCRQRLSYPSLPQELLLLAAENVVRGI